MGGLSIVLFAITSLLVSTSCHQEAVDEKTGCGCEGKAAVVITDAPARIPEAGIVYPQLV